MANEKSRLDAQDDAEGQSRPAEGADELVALRVERDDYLARLQHVSADYVNYQKRIQREIAESRDYAIAGLIKDLLPVLDDMERAIAAAKAHGGENSSLLTGMQLVHDQAFKALERYGVSIIEAEGKPFDPQMHQAVQQLPSDRHPPGTVAHEVRRGYMLKGRVLRPATVVVAVEPQSSADDENDVAADD